MNTKVDINELKECIELNTGDLDGMEEYDLYIEKETGEILSIPLRFMKKIEKGEKPEDIREWEQCDYDKGLQIKAQEEKYIHVPVDGFINEEELIKSFSWEHEDEEIGKTLKQAVNSGDVFREFKKAIYDNNIYEQWYEYFDHKVVEKIKAWCGEKGLTVNR